MCIPYNGEPNYSIVENRTENKRIAKNASMLFVRMIVTTIIGLFTSRVVLNALGFTDFGVYSLVGGLISIFAFLNASISVATQRYITFEIVNGNIESQRRVFCTAMIIHIIIAAIVALASEVVGVWLIYHKLDIPSDRLFAAFVVFQMSILSTIIGITQVPYNSTLIAHERMNIFAYIEMLNVAVKLGIAYLIMLGSFDRLIEYSILLLLSNILIVMIYRVYCIRNFQSARFKCIFDKKLLASMTSFIGQNIIAKLAYALRIQGVSIALNLNFGVLLNTANGIASTVNGSVSGFSSNIFLAFDPQITKSYAVGDYKRMQELMIDAAKYSMLIVSIFIVPLLVDMEYVLKLWLKDVPEYTTSFCCITLLSLITIVTAPVSTGLLATGNVKSYSAVQTVTYTLCPIIVYFVCRYSSNPVWSYWIVLFTQVLTVSILVLLFKKRVPVFCLSKYCKAIFIESIPIIVVAYLAVMGVTYFIPQSFFRLVGLFAVSGIIILAYCYSTLSEENKSIVMSKIRTYISNGK